MIRWQSHFSSPFLHNRILCFHLCWNIIAFLQKCTCRPAYDSYPAAFILFNIFANALFLSLLTWRVLMLLFKHIMFLIIRNIKNFQLLCSNISVFHLLISVVKCVFSFFHDCSSDLSFLLICDKSKIMDIWHNTFLFPASWYALSFQRLPVKKEAFSNLHPVFGYKKESCPKGFVIL